MKKVVLQPGREKSVLQYHPWIFSGAVLSLPEYTPGDLLPVTSASGKHLGYGYFNPKSQIIGRMVCFDQTEPHEAIRKHIIRAIALRNELMDPKTTARRLINAEGDLLPGLIVDQYDHVLVVQIATLGMERLKDFVVQVLSQELNPSWIVEVSTSASRKQEGLGPVKQTLYGSAREQVVVQEGDLKFAVAPLSGQKTGFFLDLREMRYLIQSIAKGKKVLNCCSYTGAFTCHALLGGATKVVSVDISKDAIEQTKRHVELNGFDASRHEAYVSDVFEFIEKNALDFDIVIVDPPAFAKQKKDVPNAVKAYRELNRQVIAKMRPQSFLLTCSCSYHVDDPLFRKLIFQASSSAKRAVQILGGHRLAFDHPVNMYHPEGSYLKSYFLRID